MLCKTQGKSSNRLALVAPVRTGAVSAVLRSRHVASWGGTSAAETTCTLRRHTLRNLGIRAHARLSIWCGRLSKVSARGGSYMHC